MKPTNTYINEYGEIVRECDVVPQDEATKKEDMLSKERDRLDYEIHSHPERFSVEELAEKKKRFAELDKMLGIDTKKSANDLKAAREKLRAIAAQKNQQQAGPNVFDIIAQQKKENY